MQELLEQIQKELENIDLAAYLELLKKNNLAIETMEENIVNLDSSLKQQLLVIYSQTFALNKDNLELLKYIYNHDKSLFEIFSHFIDQDKILLIENNNIDDYKQKYNYQNIPNDILNNKKYQKLLAINFQEPNEYLNELNRYNSLQINNFFKLIDINPQILESNNYDMWMNQEFSNLFIKEYDNNKDNYYQEIYNKELFNLFNGKYREILKNKDISILIKIKEIINYHLDNEEDIIKSYIENKEFQEFINHNLYNQDDALIISTLKKNLSNNYEKIYNIMYIVNHLNSIYRDISYKPSKLEFLENLLKDDLYYKVFNDLKNENMLDCYLILGKDNLIADGNIKDNLFVKELAYCHDEKNLKDFLKVMFPFLDSFFAIEYNNIKDSIASYLYEILKQVKNSNNEVFIKNTLLKLSKNFGYTNMYHTIGQSITYDDTKEILKGEINASKEEVKNIDGKENKFIFLNGEDFHFLVHCINSDFNGDNKEYMQDMLNNPTMWEDQTATFNYNLSLSSISEKNNAMFGDHLPSYTGNIRLGFFEMPLDQILKISAGDGATNVKAKKVVKDYARLYSDFVKVRNHLNRPTSDYDEILVTRFLPNGEKRKPDFLIINEIEYQELKTNSKILLWANHFNIPIVVINTKKYCERFSNEFNKFYDSNLEDYQKYKKLCECSDTAEIWSYSGENSQVIQEQWNKIYKLIINMSENLTIENAKTILNTYKLNANGGQLFIDYLKSMLILKSQNLQNEDALLLENIKKECESLLTKKLSDEDISKSR